MEYQNAFLNLLRISPWISVVSSVLRCIPILLIWQLEVHRRPREMLMIRHRRAFLFVTSVHTATALAMALTSGVLLLVKDKPQPLLLFGSVVLLSMIGQSCWMGGAWYDRAFHPLGLGVSLFLCLILSLLGSILSERNQNIGDILLVVGASLFRLSTVIQWSAWIWEAKAALRQGGNSMSGIDDLLGRAFVEVVSAVALIFGCIWAMARAASSGNPLAPRYAVLSIVVAVYSGHDLVMEFWLLSNQIARFLKAWLTRGPGVSSDGIQLLPRQVVDGRE